MPIYEYQCRSCGARIEKFQKISDDPLVACPECGQDSLEKLVSAAGFKLTGSGWYETDFKDKKPKSDNKQTGEKEKKKDDKKTPDTAKTTSSDSKPVKTDSSTK